MTTKRKRPSYREAVQWIADNDDPGSSDAENVEQVQGLISVVLVADLFGKDQEHVARDVVRARRKSTDP